MVARYGLNRWFDDGARRRNNRLMMPVNSAAATNRDAVSGGQNLLCCGGMLQAQTLPYFSTFSGWSMGLLISLGLVLAILLVLLVVEKRQSRHMMRQLQGLKDSEIKRSASIHFPFNPDETTSAIVHELNQPLTAISNYVSGLHHYLLNHAGGLDEKRIFDITDKLRIQSERAVKVAAKMRQFAKNRDLSITRVSLPLLLSQTLELIDSELHQHGCRIRVLPAIEFIPSVNADEAMMQHTIINMVRNAMEAMTEARIASPTITITLTQLTHQTVQMMIRDNGLGIPPDLTERIFEPFFSTKEYGLGIGLSLCQSMVKSMGGHLWAESAEDGGCFYLNLPIAPA